MASRIDLLPLEACIVANRDEKQAVLGHSAVAASFTLLLGTHMELFPVDRSRGPVG